METLDEARASAQASGPVRVGSSDYYVLNVPPAEITAIRRNTPQGVWFDAMKEAAKLPEADAVLIYRDTLIREGAR